MAVKRNRQLPNQCMILPFYDSVKMTHIAYRPYFKTLYTCLFPRLAMCDPLAMLGAGSSLVTSLPHRHGA